MILPITLACGIVLGAVCNQSMQINLPPGFEIAVYAEGIRNARGLSMTADGTVQVATEDLALEYEIEPLDDGDHAAVVAVARTLADPVVSREQQSVGVLADVVVAPDGAVLFSDDDRGVVYRVSYQR